MNLLEQFAISEADRIIFEMETALNELKRILTFYDNKKALLMHGRYVKNIDGVYYILVTRSEAKILKKQFENKLKKNTHEQIANGILTQIRDKGFIEYENTVRHYADSRKTFGNRIRDIVRRNKG